MPALKIPIVITVIACFTLGTFFSIPAADPMPEVATLTSAPTNSNDKVIKDLYFFVVDSSKNKDWWEWSLRQLKASKDKEGFKHISEAYSSTVAEGESAKSLNKFCAWASKNKTTGDFGKIDGSLKGIAKNFWQFCSPIGFSPISVEKTKDETYASGKIGDSKKDKVVAVTTNNTFWTQKDKWFQAQTSVTDLFFKEFYKKEDSKTKTKLTLKDACSAAYKATKASNGNSTKDNPKEDHVEKYCGFKIQTVS